MGVKFVGSLIYVLATIYIAQCYVLVKVLPPEKFEEVVENERKQINDYTKYRVRKDEKDNELESLVYVVNTGEGDVKSRKSDPLIQSIVNFIKYILDNNSLNIRRGLEKYNISTLLEPQIVSFKNGKPSMFYEINLEKVIDGVKDFINMKSFKIYSADLIQMATAVYSNVEDLLEKSFAN